MSVKGWLGLGCGTLTYERKHIHSFNSELKANAEMWIERYESLIDALKPSDKGSLTESYLNRQLELWKKILSEEK